MLRIDQIVAGLEAKLRPFVKGLKGRLVVAGDPLSALEVLLWSERGLVVVLCYTGDDTQAEAAPDDVASQRLELTVGYGLGLKVGQEEALFSNRVDRPSLYKLLDQVRAYALSIVFPADDTTGERLRYRGCAAVALPSGMPLAAYRLTLELDAGVTVGEDVEIEIAEE